MRLRALSFMLIALVVVVLGSTGTQIHYGEEKEFAGLLENGEVALVLNLGPEKKATRGGLYIPNQEEPEFSFPIDLQQRLKGIEIPASSAEARKLLEELSEGLAQQLEELDPKVLFIEVRQEFILFVDLLTRAYPDLDEVVFLDIERSRLNGFEAYRVSQEAEGLIANDESVQKALSLAMSELDLSGIAQYRELIEKTVIARARDERVWKWVSIGDWWHVWGIEDPGLQEDLKGRVERVWAEIREQEWGIKEISPPMAWTPLLTAEKKEWMERRGIPSSPEDYLVVDNLNDLLETPIREIERRISAWRKWGVNPQELPDILTSHPDELAEVLEELEEEREEPLGKGSGLPGKLNKAIRICRFLFFKEREEGEEEVRNLCVRVVEFLEQLMEDLRRERERLQEEVEALENEIEDLRRKHRNLKQQNSALQNRVETLERENNQLIDENERLKEQNNGLQDTIGEPQEQIDQPSSTLPWILAGMLALVVLGLVGMLWKLRM